MDHGPRRPLGGSRMWQLIGGEGLKKWDHNWRELASLNLCLLQFRKTKMWPNEQLCYSELLFKWNTDPPPNTNREQRCLESCEEFCTPVYQVAGTQLVAIALHWHMLQWQYSPQHGLLVQKQRCSMPFCRGGKRWPQCHHALEGSTWFMTSTITRPKITQNECHPWDRYIGFGHVPPYVNIYDKSIHIQIYNIRIYTCTYCSNSNMNSRCKLAMSSPTGKETRIIPATQWSLKRWGTSLAFPTSPLPSFCDNMTRHLPSSYACLSGKWPRCKEKNGVGSWRHTGYTMVAKCLAKGP